MNGLQPPAGQGWNAPGTCGGGYWRVVNGLYESWPLNPRNTVTLGAGLTMTPAIRPLPLYCDDPEEHGCGRKQAPTIPDLAPGFRYDQSAVMEAAEVIVRGAGPSDYYVDDPRNIVQDVLDIFIDHGGLVAMDLGYEATIIDLRSSLAAAMSRAREAEAALARAKAVYEPRTCAYGVPGCNCDRPRYV